LSGVSCCGNSYSQSNRCFRHAAGKGRLIHIWMEPAYGARSKLGHIFVNNHISELCRTKWMWNERELYPNGRFSLARLVLPSGAHSPDSSREVKW
jgi:hypothetical protein